MSDLIPVQHESAVAILRELANETAADIEVMSRKMELAQERHNGFLDAIARLTRVPRPRKTRVIIEPANDQASAPEDTSPRPTVFASPSLAEADAA